MTTAGPVVAENDKCMCAYGGVINVVFAAQAIVNV
jgi:hypothetical protein